MPEQRKIDPTPQERALAHTSLVQVGEPAILVIQEFLSLRETTVSLRNELSKILQEIRGEVPVEPATTEPQSTDPG